MQAFNSAQFDQLSYRIASLRRDLDNEQQNLNSYSPKFSSSPSNQSSSVDSSPNSSEYSSPSSSPPLSPSSVSSFSSYFSAEEDCSNLQSNQGELDRSPTNSSTSRKSSSTTTSNQSLADLITVKYEEDDQQSSEQSQDDDRNDDDDENCTSIFHHSNAHQNHHQDLLSTSASKSNDLNNNSNKEEGINDDAVASQLDSDSTRNDDDNKENTNSSQTTSSSNQLSTNENKEKPRLRKTSILRNQSSPDLTNYIKKEVKFADSLGFALENIKYFPPASSKVRPKRHSVDLATLHRDFYDEHQELFILHSRPQTEDNQILAKQFEERTNLYKKQQSKLNLNTNIFGGGQSTDVSHLSPANHQSSSSKNSFWALYTPSNYPTFSLMRDEYCGDMFHNSFDVSFSMNSGDTGTSKSGLFVNNNQKPNITSTKNKSNNCSTSDNAKVNLSSGHSSSMVVDFKPSGSLDLKGLNFSTLSSHSVSVLPLNFGQPYIKSYFPNRLRSQSVLLHSLDVVANSVNGIVSVMNLTFEKKITVKYTFNKWVTEQRCIARYSKKDRDNSDKFVFQIKLNETDFPNKYQPNQDHTMMFAISYETGDGRVYWDNNYGQDYRLKCKFN